MIAFGTPLFGGPGKSRDAQLYSRVLVDGKADAGKDSGKNGKQILAKQRADGGYVIVSGGSTYRDMGLKDLTRHLLVDFSLEGGAIISTLDRIESGASHRYTWNANLGDERSEIGPEPTAGEEAGRPYFLLTGDNGWVKGWVLSPAGAKITAADPLQITTEASSTDIWVVMLAGRDKPPGAKITGEGLKSELSADGRVIRVSDDRISVSANK